MLKAYKKHILLAYVKLIHFFYKEIHNISCTNNMLNNIIIFLIYTDINYWNKKRNFGNNKTNEKGEKNDDVKYKKRKNKQ